MNNPPKTIGLVGCGRWGKFILRDLKSIGCNVVVLALSDKTTKMAKDEHANKIVSSYSALFDAHCDGYVIASPTNTHLQVIKELMVTGKPIFTEKSLSNNVSGTKELLRENADYPLYVMDKWKYHNGILKLSELINSGKYGKVTQLTLRRTQWRSPHQDVDPVWILIPHDISIAQLLLGKTPKALYATGNKVGEDYIHSVHAILQVEKSKVIIEVSGDSVSVERSAHVVCEDASFHLANAYTDNIQMMENNINQFGDKPTDIPFEVNMPLFAELKTFVDFLNDPNVPLQSSFKHGYETIELIEQLRNMVSE
ncbi:MAG: Gfo/Idh/MocA family oxidoreductase [Gilvibacter sp.]